MLNEIRMDRKTWTTWAISILATLSVLLLIGLLFFAFRQPSLKTDNSAPCTTLACNDTCKKTDDSVPCTTLPCIDTASQLLHRMDQNVNPCDDFYQFTCGGFLNSTDNEYDIQKKQRTKMFLKLQEVLKQNISDNEPEYLKLAKKFYSQCSLVGTQIENYVNLIKPIENWPVLKGIQWNESEFNFNKTIFKVDNATEWINYFFQFNLNINDYSSIEILPISYKLTSDQLNQGLNNSDVKNYYDKMIRLSASFYTNASSNNTIVEIIKEILKFETDILNMTLLPENERSNGTIEDVKMTLDELKNNYSYFDWEGYINYHRDTPVNSTTTKIIIKDIEYLKNLKYLLDSTEKIIQSNYITWKHYQMKYEILETSYDANNCVALTIQNLPIAMGAIYYQNHGDNSIRNDILQIIMDIKKQYSDIITNSNWVDVITKKKAIEKLESLKYFIEYSKEFLNDSIIDKFYERLQFFDSDNCIDQSIRINIFNQKFLLTFNNESIWAIWGSHMLDYNAFNLLEKNILVIPPVFQNVFFKNNNLNFMNYGTIGFIIGHEIGHTFDNKGILYDANGIRNDWWTNDSLQKFDNRAKGMVEQYGNYTLPEINENVNGTLTLGENIADNSGIKAAYRGYVKKLESLNNGETLPGLSYNSKQLFWIIYANFWCEKVTPESLKRALLDVHTPNKFRIIGTLSNMQEFSNDFKCPIGSKMNPTKKYSVW